MLYRFEISIAEGVKRLKKHYGINYVHTSPGIKPNMRFDPDATLYTRKDGIEDSGLTKKEYLRREGIILGIWRNYFMNRKHEGYVQKHGLSSRLNPYTVLDQ